MTAMEQSVISVRDSCPNYNAVEDGTISVRKRCNLKCEFMTRYEDTDAHRRDRTRFDIRGLSCRAGGEDERGPAAYRNSHKWMRPAQIDKWLVITADPQWERDARQ